MATLLSGPVGIALAGIVAVAAAVAAMIGLTRRAARRAAEAERQRLQREIHDGLQQQVASLRMHAKALEQEDLPELASQLVDRLTEGSRVLFQEVRAVVHGPGVIAVEFDREVERAAQGLRAVGIPVLRRVEGEPWELSAPVAHELAMVIREALANVQKHAGENTAVLLLFLFGPEELTVEIADTGRGFDLSQAEEGAGLQGMRERVKRMRGRLEMQSEEGEGTSVRVVIPR